jgi:hypothetical protein
MELGLENHHRQHRLWELEHQMHRFTKSQPIPHALPPSRWNKLLFIVHKGPKASLAAELCHEPCPA